MWRPETCRYIKDRKRAALVPYLDEWSVYTVSIYKYILLNPVTVILTIDCADQLRSLRPVHIVSVLQGKSSLLEIVAFLLIIIEFFLQIDWVSRVYDFCLLSFWAISNGSITMWLLVTWVSYYEFVLFVSFSATLIDRLRVLASPAEFRDFSDLSSGSLSSRISDFARRAAAECRTRCLVRTP